jgi:hypothetical protein
MAKANSALQSFKVWHETNRGLLIFGSFQLLITYILGSRALDTGSLIEYFFTFVFLGGALRNLFKLVSNLIHGNKRKAKKA